jgi:uncharacterized protein (DUF2236 family)
MAAPATRASSDSAPRTPSRITADPGLYGAASEAWRLNREAMLLLGAGPRALLMQLAHPLVAEGVDQHSDFRADPWRRLQGTLRSYLRIVYGTTPQARAEIKRLNELHRSIRGPVRDAAVRESHGRCYSARDPELSLWVHATLVDSTIVAADAWLAPERGDSRRRYYQETRPIGRAFGVPDDRLPRDLDTFDEYMAAMLGPGSPIQVTPTARELGRAVLNPPLGPVLPPLGWLPSRAYAWTLWPAIGLLPPRIREQYGLAWGPLERFVSSWLLATWRASRPLFPAWLRQMPQALAADRRVRADVGEAESPGA